MTSPPHIVAVLGFAAVAACTLDQTNAIPHATSGLTTIIPPTIPSDVGATLKDPVGAHDELCTADDQHPNFPDDADLVTKTFCQDKKPGGVMPTPHSLAELQAQLGLDFKDPQGGNGVGGNPAFAILGHSSALTARKISSLTPTTFVFTPPPPDGSPPPGAYLVLAFDPGEQFVEIASYDATVQNMNFYVVFFDQACTHASGGCSPADLLTPKLVTGWDNLRVYEDTTSLGDTILDCHVCHQPDNNAAPFLRMQEIEAPFTHWFSATTEGGRALLADFHAAHGTNEDYGGIPAGLIDKSDPAKLAALVKQAGFGQQPNPFPSAEIEAEVKASSPAQPVSNATPGKSASWQRVYDAAVGGSFIAAPYHDVKVTDPKKLSAMTTAYKSWTKGTTQTLPDIRDVFLDQGLRDMGFAPMANLDGRALLVQMCQECHHASLDPAQSRERFLTDQLDKMSRAEKDLAIQRLELAPAQRLAMPPALFRTITSVERQAMINELKK